MYVSELPADVQAAALVTRYLNSKRVQWSIPSAVCHSMAQPETIPSRKDPIASISRIASLPETQDTASWGSAAHSLPAGDAFSERSGHFSSISDSSTQTLCRSMPASEIEIPPTLWPVRLFLSRADPSLQVSIHPLNLLSQCMLLTMMFLLRRMQGWKTGILRPRVFPSHCRPQTPPFLVVLRAPLQTLKSWKLVTKPWEDVFQLTGFDLQTSC